VSVVPIDMKLDLLLTDRAIGMTYYLSFANQTLPRGSPHSTVSNHLWGRAMWLKVNSFGDAD
jgi:hypothetical protein